MKKTIIALSLFAVATAATAQTYEESTGNIYFGSDHGKEVKIREDKNYPHGFTISLSGYEVAFTGKDSYEDLPPAEKRKMRYRRHYRGHLSYIDFGFNGFHNVSYRAYNRDQHGFLDLRNGKSIYFAFNVFKTSTALDRAGTFGFTTGVSLVWRNYSFDSPLTLVKRNGMIYPMELEVRRFKKSKLTTFSIDIPVLFEANLSRKFFISAGGYFGMLTGSHTKFKAPKSKSRHGNGVDLLEYGLTARAGFRHMYIFGNYGLNDVFKSGSGPKAKTYTVGFSFPF